MAHEHKWCLNAPKNKRDTWAWCATDSQCNEFLGIDEIEHRLNRLEEAERLLKQCADDAEECEMAGLGRQIGLKTFKDVLAFLEAQDEVE